MEDKILLAHGSGGSLTHQLIKEIFLKYFDNEILKKLWDSAVFEIKSKNKKKRLAFTTDSYVVSPLFFSGGDIGKLAVCGTINDLSVVGADPLFISCGLIMEEGLDLAVLNSVIKSMKITAKKAGVKIVTGDTKVVEKNSCDKLFINTSGIGILDGNLSFGLDRIRSTDKVIINGTIGDHGITILTQRKELQFKHNLKSDSAPLNGLIKKILKYKDSIRFMRDPTRGGVATTLNEIVEDRGFGIVIEEDRIPIKEEVKAACELLGLDPLYIGNEGKVIIIAKKGCAKEILKTLRKHKLGRDAAIIGEVTKEYKKKVCLKTKVGGLRLVDMPVGEQLPRIC